MNEVHLTHNLHNDLSLDNILLFFGNDFETIYIGVCDWGLTTNFQEAKQTLYTFTSQEKLEQEKRNRWWVDPNIMYLHQKNNEFQIIPKFSVISEAYSTAKIAQRINNQGMSNVYLGLQRPHAHSEVLSFSDLAQQFHLYMNRCCHTDRANNGGIAHIIQRFRNVHHWPIPTEHFRIRY